MEVEIIGFKCYPKKTFSFPGPGVTLLRGESGAGKSTILQAIKWCLFGTIRNVDQKTAKRSKLSVTIRIPFEDKECTIYRQKRPNLLKFRVGRLEQVDAVAQARIYELFGSEKMWNLCCYLEQEAHNLLFTTPASEKMDLLNKIAFHESDPTPYIQRIEELLKEEKIRFEMLQESYTQDCTELTQYLQTHAVEGEDAKTPEEIEALREEISQVEQTIAHLRERHLQHHEAVSALQVVNERISHLEAQMKTLDQEEISEEEIQRMESQIEGLMRLKELTRDLQRIQEKYQSLEQESKKYVEVEACTEKQLYTLETHYHGYQRNLQKAREYGVDYTKEAIYNRTQFLTCYLKIQPALKIHKNIVLLHTKLSSFPEVGVKEGDIEKQQEKIYLLKQGKNVLTCPQCHHSLRYVAGKLESCDHAPSTEEEFRSATSKLQELQQRHAQQKERESLIDQFNHLRKMYEEEIATITEEELRALGEGDNTLLTHQEMEQKKEELRIVHSIEILEPVADADLEGLRMGVKKGIVEQKLRPCKEEVKAAEKEVEDVREIYCPFGDGLNELPALQQQLQKQKTHFSLRTTTAADLERALSQRTAYLSKLDYGVEKEIEANVSKLKTVQERLVKGTMANDAVRKQRSIAEKRNEVVEKSKKVYYLERLKSIAVDVECQVLQQTVDSINATINVLAESMFDDPIRVELKLYKQLKTNKKIKPSVNIEIRYEGAIFEHPSEVSGGERSRLSLLLTLALNRLSGSPLLMLDETFSSLHGDIKEQCLRAIKSAIGEKTVLCVDHEATAGYYDQVLDLSRH